MPKKKTKQKKKGGGEQYDVEEIRDARVDGTVQQYLVKWLGYKELTWEPAENLSCPLLVREFEERPEGQKFKGKHNRNYVVEEIRDVRVDGTVQQFLVKWLGYKELTWEPAENLSCPLLVREFEEKRKHKISKTESTRKRKRKREQEQAVLKVMERFALARQVEANEMTCADAAAASGVSTRTFDNYRQVVCDIDLARRVESGKLTFSQACKLLSSRQRALKGVEARSSSIPAAKKLAGSPKLSSPSYVRKSRHPLTNLLRL